MSPELVRGACLCGAVAFEIETPARFCAHCHCSMCRRAHGAPLVTWAGVPDGQFRLLSGAEHLTEYRSTLDAVRTFCKTCGSSLFFRSDRWAGELHIAVASLDALPGKPPGGHVFYSDRVDWISLDDDLPRFGGLSGVEPLPRDPH